MARLESEERTLPSAIDLAFGRPFKESGMWLPYRLQLESGHRKVVLEDVADAETPVGRCALGLSPRDEVAKLIAGLRDLLDHPRRSFRFEPQEPNWCLELSSAPEGWTVVCWLDAGNQLADHYTWDAMGIRFFTDSARIRRFIAALEAERTVS